MVFKIVILNIIIKEVEKCKIKIWRERKGERRCKFIFQMIMFEMKIVYWMGLVIGKLFIKKMGI